MLYKFKDWLESQSPEVLEKMAEAEQDSLVNKVIDRIMPLLEKQAEYTVYLLTKIAEGEEEVKENKEEVPEEVGLPAQPASGSKDNLANNPPTKAPSGLQVNDVKAAIEEAIAQGQASKISSLAKAIASSYPDLITEVIKIIKIELQDACMKQMLEIDEATKISDELNSLIEDGQKEGE